jgi:hypothetical protein
MERSMSNLQSAKSAIKAEIAHAKQGLDYYKSRVEILEQALDQLEHAGAPERASGARGAKSRRQAQPAEAGRPRRGRRPGRPAANAHELPYTGGDFWLDLISDEPHSAAEILKSAVGSLGFEPDKAQVQKMRQRLTAALQAMLQAGKIKDSGAGRERRYVKGAA